VNGALLAFAAAGAVLIFWVIGAHNRLVGLRNAIAAAWAKVAEALAQRGAAVEPLAAQLREPMAAEAGALQAWQAAHAASVQAAAALTARPVDAEAAQAFVAAEAALGAASARLMALLEQHAELRGHEAVAQALAIWTEGHTRLPFARQLYNEAATAYNQAAAQFPTPIVARGFRMRPAGTL
jgi:LemA protein